MVFQKNTHYKKHGPKHTPTFGIWEALRCREGSLNSWQGGFVRGPSTAPSSPSCRCREDHAAVMAVMNSMPGGGGGYSGIMMVMLTAGNGVDRWLNGAKAFTPWKCPPLCSPLGFFTPGGHFPPTLFRFVARSARVRIEDSSFNRFALNGIQRDFFGCIFSGVIFVGGILSGYQYSQCL